MSRHTYLELHHLLHGPNGRYAFLAALAALAYLDLKHS